jgi:hypothetical protein
LLGSIIRASKSSGIADVPDQQVKSPAVFG